MFDFQISKQTLFATACQRFAYNHNLVEVAALIETRPQLLRNKLNPDQLHQLTCRELLALTDATKDTTLIDGLLAQMNCMPAVPVNEISSDNIPTYVLGATAAIGRVAAEAISTEMMTQNRKHSFLNSVNSAIRCLSLLGMTMHARIHSNPTLAQSAEAISGISATLGLN